MGILAGISAMMRAMVAQPQEAQRWQDAKRAKGVEAYATSFRTPRTHDIDLPLRTGVGENGSQYVREVYLDGELVKEPVQFDILARLVVQIKHPFNGSRVEHTTRFGKVRIRFKINGQSVWLEGE